jgi:hypothetical protein
MKLIRTGMALVRRHWRTLRLQLALLYAGAFGLVGIALLAVSGLLVHSSSSSAAGHGNGGGAGGAQNTFNGRSLEVAPALVFIATVLVALALGWLIAAAHDHLDRTRHLGHEFEPAPGPGR